MPYKPVKDHPDCKEGKPVGLVGPDGDLMGCHETPEKAMAQAEAIMKNEKKELLAEARKCYDEGMAIPMMMAGPVSFAELEELEDTREIADETAELSYQYHLLSSNILNHSELKNKGPALAALYTEYSNRMQAVGKKELEGEKAEDDGHPVTGEEGDHPPTKKNGSDEKAGKRMAGRMVDKLKQMMGMMQEMMGWATHDDDEEMPMKGFGEGFAIKQINGKPWLITYSTNAFMDREGEIFSTKSLESYVGEAEKKEDRGYFNLWHIPGTDFAKKEWQAVIGRFLIEAGPFLENEQGQKALEFFKQYPDGHPEIAPEGWGCSPEYKYLPEERKTGIYSNIWITRTSTLPRLAAANVWTKGATIMALSEQQKAAALKIFGEDLTAKIVSGAEDATKELEEAGVAHKGEQEVPAQVEVPLDEIATAVTKQLELNFQPISDALQLLGQELAELKTQVKSLEKAKAFEETHETPRYVLSLKRASEAQETVLAEGDKLLAKKPVETAPTDNSGAAHFFPGRK